MRMTQLFRFALAAGIALAAADAFAAGAATQPSICSRSCWSARSVSGLTQMSSLTRAVIHHTAGAADYNTSSQSQSAGLVRAIQNYHMDNNGWSDIGYHFLTDKLGNRFEGRATSLSSRPRGAHDGNNTNSFGFNMMGYFHTPYNQQPTSAQRSATYDIIAWKMPNGFTGFGSGSYAGRTAGYLCGHRDVGSTACPGDLLYTYIGTNVNAGEARTQVNARIVGSPAVEVIVDNSSAGFAVSANWWSASSTPGYYGSNYHTRETESISDQASWTVNLPSDGTYKVYAYWSAGANRAAAAPYSVVHAGGTAAVTANQQINGGKWNELGTWNFYQGSAVRVRLSCWTTAGYYVVADAVRFVKQ